MPEAIPTEPIPLRISAILVSYNQATALRRAVAALLGSSIANEMEIIVVDCASQDDSGRLDIEFPSLQLMRLPHHLGAARAMNIGLRTAKADLILFLSPNVEVQPATVATLAAKLEAEPTFAAVAPLLTNPQGQLVPQLRRLPTAETIGAELPATPADRSAETVTLEFPSLDALLVRKNFIMGMNYFDQRFGHSWVDADLAMQIRRSGKKAALVTAAQVIWHDAPDPLADEKLARLDRLSGAAAFLGKYVGSGAEFGFRLKSALGALARFDLGTVSGVLSGSKLDGSQAS